MNFPLQVVRDEFMAIFKGLCRVNHFLCVSSKIYAPTNLVKNPHKESQIDSMQEANFELASTMFLIKI